MLDYILRSRAAMKLRTSVVALTEGELDQYKNAVVDFYYPELSTTNSAVSAYLKGTGVLPDDIAARINTYEWWLATPLGPQACSRDIADLIDALTEWYKHHNAYKNANGVVLAKGDEWEDTLCNAVLRYQQFYSKFLVPTGYADTATLRRLRLSE